MGWGTQQQPPAYDEQRHELVEVDGQDANGHTHHTYVRDKQTQRLIGEVEYQRQIRPLQPRKGRTP